MKTLIYACNILILAGWLYASADTSFSSAALESAETLQTGSAKSLIPLQGHNLTPTSYGPTQGETVVGTYAIAYGVTQHFSVGTSPWIVAAYNMPMIDLKYATEISGIMNRIALEGIFFKTAQFGMDWYHQESIWIRATATKSFSRHYSIHTDFGFQYFWDSLAPFSMRPPPLNGTPVTLSVSALQEIHLSQRFGLFIESGGLGVNYPNPYLHFGSSGFYQWTKGYLQLGLSKTFPLGPHQIVPGAPANVWSPSPGDARTSIYYINPSPIHPELQIQFKL